MAEKLTKKEISFAIKACADATTTRRAAEAADQVKSAAMMGVFERLLGVKTMAEVAAMSLSDIARVAKGRVKRGDVELEGYELEVLLKVIQESQCRRNVSWKDEFVKALGEAEAAKIIAGTPESRSFKFTAV